ncbi:MAG: DUF1573 domain-containing protein [Prevotellaceae bacterium]|jgi:hypothetical protein|nr:DUF1573 domain-containing protein [Prevotellaceae bacterium]
MKKIFDILWFTLTFSLMSGIESNAQKIEFEKTVHDFGLVSSILGPVTYDFKFENVGDKPLSITAVSSTCGCTTSNWTKEPVKPGETGIISATYTSVRSAGPFNRNVTVRTSGSPATVILNIKGLVSNDINAVFPDSAGKLKIKEKNLFFPLVFSDRTGREQTVEVANPTDRDTLSLSFENVPKHLNVNSVSALTPRTRAQISVNVDGTKIKKLGYSSEEFTVRAGSATEKIKVAYVIAEAVEPSENQPVCEAENRVIDLGAIPAKENRISGLLEIRNTGGSDLVIKNFTTDNANFAPASKKELIIKPGTAKAVKYHAKNLPKGENIANIYLITNDPKTPALNFTVKLSIEN